MSRSDIIKTTALTLVSHALISQACDFVKFLSSNLLGRVCIETSDHKLSFAIKSELQQKIPHTTLARECGNGTIYEIEYGMYTLYDETHGRIFVNYGKDLITLYKLPRISFFPPGIHKQTKVLKNFLDEIYKKYCSPEDIRVCFTAEEDRWSFPIIRRPINFRNTTADMEKVVQDVDNFLSLENVYEEKGIAYRRGYFIHGEGGCGKTGLISVLADKYKRDVYTLNINSPKMSDTVLINLVSRVKPNSILVFEEIDKQIETLLNNRNGFLSIGGILCALDGPQGLSHGVIVILTANKRDFLPEEYMKLLLRPGRIDKEYNFQTRIEGLNLI